MPPQDAIDGTEKCTEYVNNTDKAYLKQGKNSQWFIVNQL